MIIGQPASVLNVGAGTDDWARDVQSICPQAQILCTDLTPIPSIAGLYIEDANATPWSGWSERFEWINLRNLDGGIKDWGATFKAAFHCQRKEGFLSLEQLIFYLPPDKLAPSSMWHTWQQSLGYIKAYAGLSFQLHDTRRIEEQLRQAGYMISSTNTRQFKLQVGTDEDNDEILRAIIELMKGVLVRAWGLRPVVGDKQTCLDCLEKEIGQGLEIKVVSIIAQKP
jgi:hypothetical protein